MQCQCNARGPLSKLERAPPQRKINVTSKSPVGDISVVTLIRTDTTLDHSQKAEKVCIDTSATFVEPRKCIFSSSFTSREASTSRVAHSTFVCFTQPHCLHLSRRARDGAGTWIPGGLHHCSHKIKLPSRIVKLLLKINLRGWTNVADISMHTISATFVQPRKCIFSNSFTILEASASRVAHSISICFTQPHCLHFSRRARDGAGAWIPGGLNHSSHRIKPPCFVGPKPAMPVGGDAAKKKRLDSTMCAALVHSVSSASSTLSLRSVNSSQTARQHIHRRAQRWANKFMHLSNLGKSASKLSSAINHRCNSNICNCCSLGRCKDAAPVAHLLTRPQCLSAATPQRINAWTARCATQREFIKLYDCAQFDQKHLDFVGPKPA